MSDQAEFWSARLDAIFHARIPIKSYSFDLFSRKFAKISGLPYPLPLIP